MKKHWNEIQPIDHYVVSTNGMIHDYDRKIISFLYQPLIGAVSANLYMTLLGEVGVNRIWSEQSTHYQLMNLLSLNLQEIYEARLKLEGIGLVKTYSRQNEGIREFIYELQHPLTPEEFFSDGMLNVYLYQKIGKTHYLRLREFFTDKKVDKGSYVETTRSFQDVFMSDFKVDLLNHEANSSGPISNDKQFIKTSSESGIALDDVDFDFQLLLSGLSESMVPRRSFTPSVRETVLKLSFLYGIDPIQMKNFILTALNEDDSIDVESLRKAARDWFQLQNGDRLPNLETHLSKPDENEKAKAPSTQEEKLIDYLNSTSPKDLLTDMSNGSQPSKADLQTVEEVLMTHKLPVGVFNVLIQYVLLKTDMKLTKGYLEKIASHWARKNVKTAKEAMELAKKEHKQYLDWAEGKNKRSSKSKPTRSEKKPVWFEEKESNAVKASEAHDFDPEEEKRKLEAELKNYRQ